jgi:hypothetical protein
MTHEMIGYWDLENQIPGHHRRQRARPLSILTPQIYDADNGLGLERMNAMAE